jgi:hypothetical protein
MLGMSEERAGAGLTTPARNLEKAAMLLLE